MAPHTVDRPSSPPPAATARHRDTPASVPPSRTVSKNRVASSFTRKGTPAAAANTSPLPATRAPCTSDQPPAAATPAAPNKSPPNQLPRAPPPHPRQRRQTA